MDHEGCIKDNDDFCYLTFEKNSFRWLGTILKPTPSSAGRTRTMVQG